MSVSIENNTLKPEQIQKIKDICKSHDNNKNNLINILHEIQGVFGYLPAEVQAAVAEDLDISSGRVFGVVTFYSFFTMVPKGKYPISVCLGTACYVRGAEKILDEFKSQLKLEVGETTKDGKFSLDCLRCIGACGLAPVIMIGKKVYGRVTPAKVKEIIAEYK